MNNSPYLDRPLFPLADVLKAGVKTLCTPKPTLCDSGRRVRPSRTTPQQIDQPMATCYAIGDLEVIQNQLSRLPDRAWVTRMGLIGFGSIWALIAVVLWMQAR